MAWSGASTVSPFIRRGVQILLVSVLSLILWWRLPLGDRGGNGNLPFYSTPDFTAEWLSPGSPRYAQIHKIAPFSFRNQQGELVSQASLAGKIYVANFFFTSCPGICPKMTSHLLRIQRAFASDDEVRLVSHSVMPDKDTVEVLRNYAIEHDITPGKWHLLTGDKEAIYSLARESYFAEKQLGFGRKPGEFLHTENMLLIDRQGRIRGVYNATLAVEADQAIADIHKLKREQ